MSTFQAYAKGHTTVYGATPREAQDSFFIVNPKARKCRITEGEKDGAFFVVSFSPGKRNRTFKDVTRKTVITVTDHE